MQKFLARLQASKLTHALVAALAAVLAAGLTIAVEPGPGPHHIVVHIGTAQVKVVPPAPATTKVDSADANAKPDNTVTLTPKAQDVEQTLAVGAAKGSNDLKPVEGKVPLAGSSVRVVDGQILKDDPTIAQLQPPFASDSVPGCRTRFLRTNWSARAPGVRVEALALHYTAGADIPNSRADVDGLTAFGNQPSSAVSWAVNEDKDGNCDYNVPYRYKAWTIAGLNSATVDYEIAGKGDAPYLRPAGYRELARLWLDFHRRYPYIPLRLGATDGHCNVTRTGIITHWMGGPCSGGHVDIKPFQIQQVIATLRKYVAQIEHPKPKKHKHVTTADRRECRHLQYDRRHKPPYTATAHKRWRALRDVGVLCTRSGARLRK